MISEKTYFWLRSKSHKLSSDLSAIPPCWMGGTFSVWPVSKTFETLSKLSIKWKNCELWTKTCSKEEKLLPNNKFIPNMGTQVWGWNQKKEKVLNLWLISGLEEKLASGLLFEEKLNLKIMPETKSLNSRLGQSQRRASPLFHSTNH